MRKEHQAHSSHGAHLSDTVVGIKDHHEKEMRSAETGDLAYLHGMDPAEYSLKQENELAHNIRKHRAP